MRSSLGQRLVVTVVLGVLMIHGTRAQGQQPAATEGLKLGEAAPDFALPNIEGKKVSVKDFRGKKNVVLVFYPAMFRAGG